MADWRDVMHARFEADGALNSADAYGGEIEDGRTSDPALALLLAARAITLELRSLAMLIDHARGDS